MARGPERESKEQLLRQTEAIIDRHLAGNNGEYASISTDLLPDRFSITDWPALKRRYKQSGWKHAEWISDQREGDYLEFKA